MPRVQVHNAMHFIPGRNKFQHTFSVMKFWRSNPQLCFSVHGSLNAD